MSVMMSSDFPNFILPQMGLRRVSSNSDFGLRCNVHRVSAKHFDRPPAGGYGKTTDAVASGGTAACGVVTQRPPNKCTGTV